MRTYLDLSQDKEKYKEEVLFWNKEQDILDTLISFVSRRTRKIYSEILPDELPVIVNTSLHDYFCEVFVPLSEFKIEININLQNEGICIFDEEITPTEIKIFKALGFECRKISKTEEFIELIGSYKNIFVKSNNPVIATISCYFNEKICNRIVFLDKINISPCRFPREIIQKTIVCNQNSRSIRSYFKEISSLFKSKRHNELGIIILNFDAFDQSTKEIYEIKADKRITSTSYQNNFPFNGNNGLNKHQRKLVFSFVYSNKNEHNHYKEYCEEKFLYDFFNKGYREQLWEENLSEIFEIYPNSVEFLINKISRTTNHKDRKELSSYFIPKVLRKYSYNNKSSAKDNNLHNYFKILSEMSFPNKSNELFFNYIERSENNNLVDNFYFFYSDEHISRKRIFFLHISYFYQFHEIIDLFEIARKEGLEFEFVYSIINSTNINMYRFLYDIEYRKSNKSAMSELSNYLGNYVNIHKYANYYPHAAAYFDFSKAITEHSDVSTIICLLPLVSSECEEKLIVKAIFDLEITQPNAYHLQLLYFLKLFQINSESVTDYLENKILPKLNSQDLEFWNCALQLIENKNYNQNLSYIENQTSNWFFINHN